MNKKASSTTCTIWLFRLNHCLIFWMTCLILLRATHWSKLNDVMSSIVSLMHSIFIVVILWFLIIPIVDIMNIWFKMHFYSIVFHKCHGLRNLKSTSIVFLISAMTNNILLLQNLDCTSVFVLFSFITLPLHFEKTFSTNWF